MSNNQQLSDLETSIAAIEIGSTVIRLTFRSGEMSHLLNHRQYSSWFSFGPIRLDRAQIDWSLLTWNTNANNSISVHFRIPIAISIPRINLTTLITGHISRVTSLENEEYWFRLRWFGIGIYLISFRFNNRNTE